MVPDTKIPDFTIRESKRAKKVILRLYAGSRLEVVIPVGFSRKKTAEIVARKADWIHENIRRLEQRNHFRPPAHVPPVSIILNAIDKKFDINLKPGHPGKLEVVDIKDGRLYLIGDHHQTELVRRALQQWLVSAGKKYLVPSLKDLSRQTGLSYRKSQVRIQKTRWGSCSRKGTISLNAKLLFFPPDVVRYVMIHELCHTLYLNHSRQYWSMVAKWEPNYRSLDKILNDAWKWVPLWANPS